MLTISKRTVKRNVAIGDFFDELGCNVTLKPTDTDGDTVWDIKDYNIHVESLNAQLQPIWLQIEAIRWTKPELQTKITLTSGRSLQCSPQHVVMARRVINNTVIHAEWYKVEDLTIGDQIVTTIGPDAISIITPILKKSERLCDLQVANLHSYLSNEILSHNSHALVDLGTQALLDRKNVVHYTCELSENAVGIRYDSRLTEIPSNEIVIHKKEVLQIEDGLKLGKLYIKGYSVGAASISTLRSHIERLMLQNFVPDVVIVDYADLLRSSRRYDSPRFELKLIYEELRALATDLNIPVWTASQSNKEGANSDIVGLENMGEAYAKAATCDVVIGLSRKPEEKATGCGRLFLAKNRAGRDGINWPIRIDTACSKISLSDEPLDGTEFKQQAERDVKAKLRAKYDELHHSNFPIKELERHTYPEVKLP